MTEITKPENKMNQDNPTAQATVLRDMPETQTKTRQEAAMPTEPSGILLGGRFYQLSPGSCKNCHLAQICDYKQASFCQGFPFPDPTDGRCFRYSQELTDKINN